MLPTISRYAESVMYPRGVYRSLGEPVCARDGYDRPVIRAGGSSAVFKVIAADRTYALKCYTKPKEHLRRIVEYFDATGESLVMPTRYLPGELYVWRGDGGGEWVDVMLVRWAEGHGLDFEINRALRSRDCGRLAELADGFARMSLELLGREWAHGDLKPENIRVSPSGEMRLTDYDAVWLPAFGDSSTQEAGTPGYRHPLRDEHYFNKSIDDYPIALIYAMLVTMAHYPDICDEVRVGEPFPLSPEEAPGMYEEAIARLMTATSRAGDALTYRLLGLLSSPTPAIAPLAGLLSYAVHGYAVHGCAGAAALSPFCEGAAALSPFCEGGAWGYADDAGRVVVPPMFDSALEFSDSLAAVKLGGWSHFVDECGRTAIDCSRYESVKSFSEGFAAAKRGGVWGFINSAGEEVVEPVYDRVSAVRGGVAEVKTGKETKTIRLCTRQE